MVWSTVPLLDAAAEADTSAPKLLATLSEHQGSVLVARFSRSGRLLASGGNDNAVLLYRLAPGPGGPRLGCRYASTENWRTTGALRGHSLDVTDLAWAPGDSMLATASMDGTVLVYSVTADGAGSLLHSIRGAHHGWVKGLAFDPLGRYLASQGRNGVKIWDISADWAAAGHVRGPYERAPEAAFRFRCVIHSWVGGHHHSSFIHGCEGTITIIHSWVGGHHHHHPSQPRGTVA
jgi:protein HIRA/HIR1